MGKMRIAEDSPAKLVLEKTLTTGDIWFGWGKYFVNPLVILAVLYVGLYIMSVNKLSSPTWLYWAIGIGVLVAEIFALYAVLYAKRKTTITFDSQSRVASQTIIFVSGKRQKSETVFEKVSRIVLHVYTEIHLPRLELDVSEQSNFIIAEYFDLQSDTSGEDATNDVPTINSLESLGKKIGQILEKPVIQKITEADVDETLVSEEVIQP